MHQCKPCQPFSKMCPFYPADLLLGPQDLRLVAVWSSLVLALVLLDEFCIFCSNNFIEHQIRLCQDHQSTMTQIKGRSEMTKGKINSLNCEWVWLFSFHVDWFRKKSLEVSLYRIDEKILSIGG